MNGPARPSNGYARYVLFVLFIVNTLNYVDRIIVAAILPLLQADLKFTDGQAGLLTGLAFAVLYATVGLPLGRFADRGNRRTLVSAAVAIWSCATAACGFAQSFAQLFLARVGVGIGEAGCVPASHSLIGDYFPPERRSSALAVQMSGASIGAIAGLTIGGYLGTEFGWRVAFWAVGAPGLAVALLVRLTLREPRRGGFDPPGTATTTQTGPALRALLGNRTYVQLGFAFSAMAFCSFGVAQWAPSFFFRYHDVPLSQIGALFGLSYGVGSVIGAVIGGLVGDRLIRKNVRAVLWFCAAVFAAAIVPGLGFILAPTLAWSLAANFVFSILAGCAAGPTLAIMQSVVAPNLRATATALCMFLLALLGIGAGPTAVGLASDLLASATADDSLRYALTLPIAGVLWATLHLTLAARTVVRDTHGAAIPPLTAEPVPRS